LSKTALKCTYGNVEFQKFPGEDPRTHRSKGGKGRGGKRGEVGKAIRRYEGKECKGRAKGKGRMESGEKGGGEGKKNLDPPIFHTDRRHCTNLSIFYNNIKF
jgi:hypothetical protein